jgi:hypothetical protein
MNKEQCKIFLKNPEVNPITGRKIKKESRTYKKLMSQCDILQVKGMIRPRPLSKNKVNNKDYKKFKNKCSKDKSICNSIKKIQTSIKKIKSVRKQSPDIIIKKSTKRIKDKTKLLAGTKLTELIMIVYLLKKHTDSINILLKEDLTDKFIKLNTNKIKIDDIHTHDYLTTLKINPYSKGPDEMHFPYDDKIMKKYFKNIKTNKNRFTFLLLSIFSDGVKDDWSMPDEDSWAHMNFLVYDKIDNTIYRFEPQGGIVNFYNSMMVDNFIKKKLKQYNIKYKSMNDYCFLPQGELETFGPQALEYTQKTQETDPIGFCSYWSIYFIDYILTNHKRIGFEGLTIQKYLDNMINDIYYKVGSYKDFIRTFAVFINNAAINIGKNKNIEKYIENMINKI